MAEGQRKPLGQREFIQQKNFEEASQKFENRTVLIIAGPSGCGKTELALQLRKQYQNEDRNNFFGDLIACDSKERLLEGLQDFVRRVPLNIDPNLMARGELDVIFDAVFKEMNMCFGNKTKFLIFDDAEVESDVTYHIDQAILSALNKQSADGSWRKSWKIVITTQINSPTDWLRACDHLEPDSLLSVNGLYDDEIPPLLKQSKRGDQFTDKDKALMKETFGNRPLMLNVVKAHADKETSMTPSQVLRQFIADIGRLGDDNKDVKGLFVSIQRVVERSDHVEEYKQFIMMLTMFHETNIPKELLISCAEVIVSSSGVRGIEDVGKKAKNLYLDFIHDMTKRSLFDEPQPYGNTTLLSFHKLFKQGMKQYRIPKDDVKRDLQIALKALLALTRVMPRDGRGHKSHLYSFMYRHADILLKEVEKLIHYEDLVSPTETPLAMLLTCILHLSMGYCRYSMKSTTSDALMHVNEALTMYSQLFVDREYDQLGASNPDLPEPLQKARTLLEECFDSPLPLEINDWLKNLPFYLQLTDRDKHVLFPKGVECDFLNGHLDETQMRKVRHEKHAIKPDELAKFYSVEILADIYSMAAKICSTNVEDKAVEEYHNAANFLYQEIRDRTRVTLLAEIVLEREMLNMKLKSKDLSADVLDEMVERWTRLSDTNELAFEGGLMRANFRDDPYNRFLCNEGLLRCKGRKCAIEYDEGDFTEINKLFREHLRTAEEQNENPKLLSNNQTVSKAYRYYGGFLLECGQAREAVRAIIDSLYYLNRFLEQKAEQTPFRELEINCGKARPLWDLLETAFRKYDDGHSEGHLLVQDGTDNRRLAYIKESKIHWRSQCGPEDSRFAVLEKILEACGISEDDSSNNLPLSRPIERSSQ